MKITVPHYYSRFQCVAGQCPDTCCAGWQIMIDETSLKKIQEKKRFLRQPAEEFH